MRWKKERKKEIIVLTNTFLRMKREAIQAGLKPTLETKESFLLHIYPNRVQPAYNPSKHTRLKEKRKGELANMKIEREWWEGEWGNIYIYINKYPTSISKNTRTESSSPLLLRINHICPFLWKDEFWRRVEGAGENWKVGSFLFCLGDQDFGTWLLSCLSHVFVLPQKSVDR